MDFWKDLSRIRQEHPQFCMAVIIQHHGSTPRSSGARMLVYPGGGIWGTIGGGSMEASVIQAAQQALQTGRARIVDFTFSGADAASLDMICGGGVRVLLEPVAEASTSLWAAVEQVQATREGWLVSTLHADGQVEHRFLADLSSHPAFACAPESAPQATKTPYLVETKEGMAFADPLVRPVSVYIFGAGHVSQALVRMLTLVDFATVVIDDRAEFANRERFPQCGELLVLDPITQLFFRHSFIGEDMIVILTRGHLQDLEVLEPALATNAGYVGMIGSRRKREAIYAALRAKGIPDQRLARVHSPIGLDIRAETPEEIAVSITAELIRERARLQKGDA
jgi:xanthine dehydrogenase accessory factor